MNEMKFKANLGRAVLQLSDMFSDPSLALWEYISNSIQYREKLDGLKVTVLINKNEVEISDNSDGMDETILQSFFTYAGENLARKGRQVSWHHRGKNGTGKLAAFGIANILEVETVKDGYKNKYRLTRKSIEQNPEDSQEIPIEAIVHQEKTLEKNGTKIFIKDLKKEIDSKRIVRKIEREISPYRTYDAKFLVNSVLCEFKQPEIDKTYNFESEGPIKQRYGQFNLQVVVTRHPLDSQDKGIKIMCDKAIVGIEDYGVSKQRYGNYITGEVDIPDLEKPIDNIMPFDQSRRQVLNNEHEGVRELMFFVAPKLEKVRKDLEESKTEEENSAQNKKLKKITDDLSSEINKEWNNIKRKIEGVRIGSNSNLFSEILTPNSEGNEEPIIEGDGISVAFLEEIRSGESVSKNKQGKDSQKIFNEDEKSDLQGKKTQGKKKKINKGGFSIVTEGLGENEHKSLYNSEEAKIIINLDHPTTKDCLRSCDNDVENESFKRYIFESVCREFEHAFAQELISDQINYAVSDVLSDMRFHYDAVVRRLSSKFYS